MVDTSELRNLSFLKGLPESDLTALASITVLSAWREGDTIFEAGSRATILFILKSGAILLSFPTGRAVPIWEPGRAIGWSAIVSPFEHTGSAVCLTDATLYQLPGRDLDMLMRMDVDLGQRIMQRIVSLMEERRVYR